MKLLLGLLAAPFPFPLGAAQPSVHQLLTGTRSKRCAPTACEVFRESIAKRGQHLTEQTFHRAENGELSPTGKASKVSQRRREQKAANQALDLLPMSAPRCAAGSAAPGME